MSFTQSLEMKITILRYRQVKAFDVLGTHIHVMLLYKYYKTL
jgi:hypothetical protein